MITHRSALAAAFLLAGTLATAQTTAPSTSIIPTTAAAMLFINPPDSLYRFATPLRFVAPTDAFNEGSDKMEISSR